jgi:hypothetical protein
MTENKAQPEKLDLRSQDTGEARVITFGVSASGRLLVVGHTEHGDTSGRCSSRGIQRLRAAFHKYADESVHPCIFTMEAWTRV